MIDDCPPGRLVPMRSAECALVRARLADRDGYAAADAVFVVAISALRCRPLLDRALGLMPAELRIGEW